MLLSILMTIFGLIAVFEGFFFLLHLQRPFLIFEPDQNPALSSALKTWGPILIIIGILAIIAGWMKSIPFITIMVIVGCVIETLMAYSLMGHFQAQHRQK